MLEISQILRGTIVILQSCHIMGSDAESFAGAIRNLKTCSEALEKAKKEENGRDNHNGQGENV